MPHRPPQHQIDSAGQAIFRSSLPSSWVIRELIPDYGVDYQVEVFDDDGAWTGTQFYVQLKSTRQNQGRSISVALDFEELEYWKSLALPVLIVVADVRQRQLRVRWAHDLDPFPRRSSDRRSVRFPFRPRDLWSERYPKLIRRYAEAWRLWAESRFPVPIPLSVESSNAPGTLDLDKARRILRRELQRFEGLIRLQPRETVDVGGVVVRLDRDETRFALPRFGHLVIDHEGALQEEQPDQGAELLICLGLALARAEHQRVGAELIAAAARRSGLWSDERFAVSMALALQDGGKQQFLLELLREMFTSELAPIADAVLARLVLEPGAEPASYESLIELEVARYERLRAMNSQNAGVTAYAVAALHRVQDRQDEALSWYERTTEADPRYKSRAYWHRDRGGCLYLLGRYVESAAAYDTASAFGDDEPTLPILIGDAYTGSGRFAEALEAYAGALSLPGRLGAEARLLSLALERILSEVGLESQSRKPEQALKILEEAPADWETALRLDASCPAAWEVKAFEESGSVSIEDLVTAAVLARYDPRLWLLALVICAGSGGLEDLGRDCAAAAKFYVGEDMLGTVDQMLEETELRPSSHLLGKIMEWYDAVPPDPKRLSTLRVHYGDETEIFVI